MKLNLKKGSTSRRVAVFVQNSSASGVAGLAGLAYNSAGLTAYYWREDAGNAGATAIALATATRGTWASGGFVEKDATNLPGWYEFGIPDAALASGAKWVIIQLRGATNMVPVLIEIQLTDSEPDSVSDLLSATNTGSNDGTTVGGQIRRTHALAGGTKVTQDGSAANPTVVHRNEADSAALVTCTRTAAGSTQTVTPS